jgi:hypothetical protein
VPRNTVRPGSSRTQRVRSITRKSRDPYVRDAKHADAVVCDHCGVVGHGGRWYWGAPPLGEVRGGSCPACERIRDRAPAGSLRLSAAMRERRDEVVRVVRSLEAAERLEHPLERLIAVTDRRGQLWVSTTGIHLARRIASQLARRFHAKPRIRFDRDHEVRIDWAD